MKRTYRDSWLTIPGQWTFLQVIPVHYHFANGTFVVLLWYKLNYSPFSSIFVVLCLFYHSVSGIFWDFDGNSNK